MCTKVKGFLCTPGMKGCVLYGKIERKEEIDSTSDLKDSNTIEAATGGPAGSWDADTIRGLYNTKRKV